MRYGIIDVGSNTIRLIIFELKGTEIKIILKEKELSVILSFIQNGNLMEEGLERLLLKSVNYLDVQKYSVLQLLHLEK